MTMATHRSMFAPLVAALMVAFSAGCTPGASTAAATHSPSGRGGVTLIGPECAGVQSCLMGQVIAAESAAPLAQATIFLEREDAPEAKTEEDVSADVHIMRITDEEGVFTVIDAPAGRYRLAVYKEERSYEVRGLTLGEPGTVVVPVRLPKV